MRKLIITIMFLLLFPSLVLAEEKSVASDEEVNHKVSRNIANKIFLNEFWRKYKHFYIVEALLWAAGHENFADEVSKDEPPDDYVDLELFLKYSKNYKYTASDSDMFLSVFVILDGMERGYKMGMHDVLDLIVNTQKEVAYGWKVWAPQLYEEYLEAKKKAKDKP